LKNKLPKKYDDHDFPVLSVELKEDQTEIPPIDLKTK